MKYWILQIIEDGECEYCEAYEDAETAGEQAKMFSKYCSNCEVVVEPFTGSLEDALHCAMAHKFPTDQVSYDMYWQEFTSQL